jgi:hypothetical protein
MEMPNDVDKCVQKMIHNDIRRRPTATHALKYPLFNSEHISLLASLGEMAIKSTTEIVDILGNISNQVNTIPKSICLYKLLPSVSRVMQMSVNDFNNRDARESCRQVCHHRPVFCLQLSVLTLHDDLMSMPSSLRMASVERHFITNDRMVVIILNMILVRSR